MLIARFAVVVSLMILGVDVVSAQNYPNKPIRIVSSGAGGSPDVVARLLASGLSVSLGQQLIVDNRTSGVIPGEIASRAQPDGYTLLVTSGILWTGPLMPEKTPYDPVKDFLPITLAGTLPNILVGHPSLPANSVKELIALAKARPGKLNYASSATGSSSHLAAELFRFMAGIDITQINYKGAGPALNGTLTGEVQMAFVNAASVTPLMKSGRLKALAVASAGPSALAPGLPTIAASGLPGYESVQVIAMFAPAKTPATIINRLNQEAVRFLTQADIKEKLLSVGVEVVASSPSELAAKIKSEMVRLGKLIKDVGIRAE